MIRASIQRILLRAISSANGQISAADVRAAQMIATNVHLDSGSLAVGKYLALVEDPVFADAIQFAVSALGVLIFAGLTAYDTQNIKNTYIQMATAGQTEWLGKAAIMGALSLYLDFINMFMFLLQFLGARE